MAIEHEIKTADGGLELVELTPIKAIRKHCLECVAWSYEEVKGCTARSCPLYPYRLGRRP
jgi:hypothetical protein